MAPDLNSVPPSPRISLRTTLSTLRRTSQPMAPPPVPLYTTPLNTHLPSTNIPATPVGTNSLTTADNTGVGMGPGPLRHPRPLTAADLHLQLEKEQEAVVNRLTRELSLLRQQSASVVSNASSTSTGLPDSSDHNSNHLLSGPSHPTPSRRHRSSSNLSSRSATTAATTTSNATGLSGNTLGTTAGIAGSTISGITPARDPPPMRESLGRHDSVTSSRRSEASSPSLASSLHQSDHFPSLLPPRHSISIHNPISTSPIAPHHHSTSPSTTRLTRFEEIAHHRFELDAVKRENEMLRRRIRDLERTLSHRRRSEHGHERSNSASTSTSVSQAAMGQRRPVYEEDDGAVGVGESAGSVGFGEGV